MRSNGIFECQLSNTSIVRVSPVSLQQQGDKSERAEMFVHDSRGSADGQMRQWKS